MSDTNTMPATPVVDPIAPVTEASTAAATAPSETSLAHSDPLQTPADADADAAGAGAKRKEFSGADRGGRGAKRGRGGRGGGGRGGARAGFVGGEHPDDESAAASAAASEPLQPPTPATPIQAQFALFATHLDARNDRRETAYQASRDLTRASKRLISALQRVTSAPAGSVARKDLLASSRASLSDLERQLGAAVGLFATAEEAHRFGGAVSPGLQEFIEAATLLHFLETGELLTHAQLEASIATTVGKRVEVPLSDYLLGALDLGGELMRFATNSVATGDRNAAADICTFLRSVYAAYQRLSSSSGGGGAYRELGKKLDVWLQSLVKIESLCYKLHIRGAEVPDARLFASVLNMSDARESAHARDTGDATAAAHADE